MHRNKSVNVHNLAMVPRAEIPRSSFRMQKGYKTTFNAADLVPIALWEVLPGDTYNVNMTAFARMTTPLVPIMDNLHFESFFFFVPMRLVWENWQRFMGEQTDPADSIEFEIPVCQVPDDGYAVGSLQDYFGLPTAGQYSEVVTTEHSCLPLRAYNLIYNEWFRDENLQDSVPFVTTDGTESVADFVMLKRGKRKDYFTGCLPWPQKGGVPVTVPVGVSAPVTITPQAGSGGNVNASPTFQDASGAFDLGPMVSAASTGDVFSTNLPSVSSEMTWNSPGLQGVADLTLATGATINQLRQSFQIQKLLERDARGGTRYIEIIRSHFGVISPDARLQRPEYLGGGSVAIAVNPVAQTGGTGTGAETPQGNLAAFATGLLRHGFTQSFTEHGYIIGIVNVRADLTYQQGLQRLWSRSTRYDFYFPVFAMLGEQPVYNREIFCSGAANDSLVFGYQERWAEYRYDPSMITGQFRSTVLTGGLDVWHLAEEFASQPLLNSAFITDHTDQILARNLAIQDLVGSQQFYLDAFFDNKVTRPLPMYSVPGMIDHF